MIRIDSLIQSNNALMQQIELDLSLKQRYKLYQTDNIYTFLQLDTKTGRIKQVQWSLDSAEEGSVIINDEDSDEVIFGVGENKIEKEIDDENKKVILYDEDSILISEESPAFEEGFSRDVSDIGHWGTGKVEIRIKNKADFEKAKPLLDRAYNEN